MHRKNGPIAEFMSAMNLTTEKDDYLRLENKIKEKLIEYLVLLKSSSDKRKSCKEEMLRIADDIDKVHRGATIASVTGSSVGIAGGITTIVGLALAPVTFGASLIVTLVGIGVATAGGVTGAVATVTDTVSIKKKCRTVQEMISDIKKVLEELLELLECINKWVRNIEELRNTDRETFDDLVASGKFVSRGVFAATEVSRLAQLIKVSASAARGIRVAGAISGVLTAIFMVIDTVFLVKDALELKNGAKTEQAEEIRKVANDVEEKFQELENIGTEIKSLLMKC
ncbi:apolipoprotein L3-like [Discoglossus pictus]